MKKALVAAVVASMMAIGSTAVLARDHDGAREGFPGYPEGMPCQNFNAQGRFGPMGPMGPQMGWQGGPQGPQQGWHHAGRGDEHFGFGHRRGGPRGFGDDKDEIKNIPDTLKDVKAGQRVFLKGKLTEKIDDEHYRLSDDQGSVIVILDDDEDWSYLAKDEPIRVVGKIKHGDSKEPMVKVKFARPEQPKDGKGGPNADKAKK